MSRNQEYWKAAVAYHERELAQQRRLLKQARAKLAEAEKEEKGVGQRTTNRVE